MIMGGDTIPTPKDIARRLPQNQGERGDTIVYYALGGLRESMIVEGFVWDKAGIRKIYEGSGNRLINSREVIGVLKA